MAAINEEKLIKKAQGGDKRSFEALMDLYFRQIYNIAFRIGENSEDAADMTQEIMVKIYKNISSFAGNSKFSTWVYRVATNTCLDYIKKTKRHSALSLDAEIETGEGSYAAEIRDTALTPEQAYEGKELRDMVAAAIKLLNDDHRVILVLRDIQGLSYDEISHILHCSEGTVKSRISRARAQLKNIMEKNFGFDGTYFKS